MLASLAMPARRRQEHSMSILTAAGLTKPYGPTFIFGDSAFRVARADTIGLVGVNGAGKSTPLTIVSGIETPTRGGLHPDQTTRVAYLPQEPRVAQAETLAAVLAALSTCRRLRNRSLEGGL
jgi:ATPase subunit of ABC transporter with duplicated ATPase domains